MSNKAFKIFIASLAALLILMVLVFGAVKISPAFKNGVKTILLPVLPESKPVVFYFVNGEKSHDIRDVDLNNSDIKEIQKTKDKTYVINRARGYAMEFGSDAEFDFTKDSEYFTVTQNNMKITVSKEFSPYLDTKQFVDESLNKYFLNERFAEHNRIKIHKNSMEKIGDYWMQISIVSRTPAPESEVLYNTYAQCIVYTGTRHYYRFLFKADEYGKELDNQIYKTLYSFTDGVEISGVSKSFTDFEPVENKNWSAETKALYEEIKNSDKVKWGIYVPWSVTNSDFEKISDIENKLDYNFGGVLEYMYLGQPAPIEGMKKAYDDGKIIELTLQTSTVMNLELDSYNVMFDIIDGQKDNEIKALAQSLKDFAHPFLFRLNNEMNSDWTTYGGNITLNDPEIYVAAWQRIYNIFEREGVNNAIWVFNPNDRSFPTCGFNSSMAYYPGNGYVHMFGITGYNTGTYYAEKYMESWKEFDEIYSEIVAASENVYGRFPWIITEFASSSVGGDKAAWIENMFRALPNYPRIKMAFWFSSADYDADNGGRVSRPYWIDENEECVEAFKKNLKE